MVESIIHKDQKENLVLHQELMQHQERREEVDLFLENDDLVIDLVEEDDTKGRIDQLDEDDLSEDQVDQLVQEDKIW